MTWTAKLDDTPFEGPELPFGPSELAATTKVIECLARYPQIMSASWLRPLRKALIPLAESLVNRTIKDQEKINRTALQQATALAIDQMRKRDLASREKCLLRQERHKRLKLLTQDETMKSIPLVPDGAVDESLGVALPTSSEAALPPCQKLHFAIKCYICKSYFTQLHHFYHNLCPSTCSVYSVLTGSRRYLIFWTRL
ncbi:hypothetical protein PINS_up021954 [Pythium insidiosum]|nr:hypothetical protein PINS_up021954 [Pythium insidiosum]